MMTYNEAIKYIHSVSNFFCKPGLERVNELCRGLGDPQKELKFIHVGGTNGKGSFCAITDSILRAGGYKVGLYTSPFVRVFNERMRVNGENIPNDTLARLTERAKSVADKMADRPTEFELITAIAFEYFREERCDVVILEVGMGGRLDATNIIENPLLSVITGISIDHTSFLGNTTAEIATEKAGIVKQGCPTLWGGLDLDAEAVIAKKAKEMQSALYKTAYNELKNLSLSLSGSRFDYKRYSTLNLSMLGQYQPKNAATALSAIEILSDVLPVSDEAIREGLRNAKWPARFEIIGREPLIIFDGAHNAEGISAAVGSAKEYFGDESVIVISGVLRDKDYHKIASDIAKISHRGFTITPDSPRALPAADYANVLTDYDCHSTPCESVADAINKAICAAKEENTAILILGSLYTYSEVMDVLEK